MRGTVDIDIRCGAVFVSIVLALSLIAPSGAIFAYEATWLDENPVPVTEEVGNKEPVGGSPSGEVVIEAEVPPPTMSEEKQAVATPEVRLVSSTELPSLTVPETTPPGIVTGLSVSSTIEYIELYNQSDTPLQISDITVVASRAGEAPCTVRFMAEGWLRSREYLGAASPTTRTEGVHTLSADCLFSGDIQRIEIFNGATRWQLIDGISLTGTQWLRHKSVVSVQCADKTVPSSLKQTGSASNDFITCTTTPLVKTSILYLPPALANNLMITELMTDSRSCPPGDEDFGCFDYIKVKNTGSTAVDLAQFRLRTGASTSSATASNTFHWQQPTLHPDRDELLLHPGASLTVRFRDGGEALTLTNGDGNVWIEDYFGVTVYQTVSYSGMSLAAARGKSFAYDEASSVWLYGIPSPYGENRPYRAFEVEPSQPVPTLKPCRDDQYRSEETNRCRNIVTASALVPCREGQYRSEETNRCRSIASAAASVLKPCDDDQYRNPATNRCKKIASADDIALADCGEGRERNPLTNRCRNSIKNTPPAAGFAVEPVADGPAAFVGWWVLAGIVALAIGYAIWEWHEEMGRFIRKVVARLSKTNKP